VPFIQLKIVLLAQIAIASIAAAVMENPGFLRSRRTAKRTSCSSPIMTAVLQ
jgi:archaellin